MLGLGPSWLEMPLLIALFAEWVRLFWHELRQNWVSWRAFVVLGLLLALWFIVGVSLSTPFW
jgi:hypothetical protein